MSKTSKVKKSKKPKRRSPGTYAAYAVLTFGLPPTSKLAAAKAAFDAAQAQAVAACVVLSRPGFYTAGAVLDAEEAGFALQDAYAAILRARADEQPIPVKLTAKGKTAKLKPFHAVPSRRRSK